MTLNKGKINTISQYILGQSGNLDQSALYHSLQASICLSTFTIKAKYYLTYKLLIMKCFISLQLLNNQYFKKCSIPECYEISLLRMSIYSDILEICNKFSETIKKECFTFICLILNELIK